MSVPSTPTLSDSLLELKKVRDEIAGFNATREKAERDTNEMLASLEDLQARKKILEEEAKSPESSILDVIGYTRKILNECILTIRAAQDHAQGYLKLVKVLSDKSAKMKKEVDELQKLKEDTHKEIVLEETRLGDLKNDLLIYKERLERKIAAYGLSDDIKIIL